jgi:fission process protein 1
MPVDHDKAEAEVTMHREVRVVLDAYDADGDGQLSPEEVAAMKADYKNVHATPVTFSDGAPALNTEALACEKKKAAVVILRQRYDKDGDGDLDDAEMEVLQADVKSTDTFLRYFGYSALVARGIKYGRVAVGQVMHPLLVKSSFLLSWGYVGGDVGYESYKQYVQRSERSKGLLFEAAVERLTFQGMSSVVMPFYTIRTVVRSMKAVVGPKGLKVKSASAVRWVPPVCGLACLPLMPYVWDAPCELGVRFLFGGARALLSTST